MTHPRYTLKRQEFYNNGTRIPDSDSYQGVHSIEEAKEIVEKDSQITDPQAFHKLEDSQIYRSISTSKNNSKCIEYLFFEDWC